MSELDRPIVPILSPIFQPTLLALQRRYDCRHVWPGAAAHVPLAAIADRVEALVTHSGAGIDAARIDSLPNLRFVACFGVGIDSIDLAACAARGIRVTNTPDVLTDDVADMALALMLAVSRRLLLADRFVRSGRWSAGPMALTSSLTGRRVGIIGLGRIGGAIAHRCRAFGMQIAYHGRHQHADSELRYFADLEQMASWAQVLVAACPGGAQTQGIVSRAVLGALGKDGVFVNIARGSVLDEPALIELLREGRLGGAGLDVFADEPNVPSELLDLDNVVLQPHHASGTEQTRAAMGELVLGNLAAYFAGEELLTPVA